MSIVEDVSNDVEEADELNLNADSLSLNQTKVNKSSFASFVGTAFSTGGEISSGLITAIVSIWSKNADEVSPFPCQRETWNALSQQIEQRQHLLVQSATGSGKTIAFLTPVLAAATGHQNKPTESNLCFPYAVIVAPTRELALQISHCAETIATHAALCNIGVHVISAIGGVGFRKQVNEVLSLTPGPVVVVATPGRLLALCGVRKEGSIKPTPPLATNPALGAFTDLPAWLMPPPPVAVVAPAPVEQHEEHEEIEVCLSLSHVTILVLDEADEMIKGGFGKELEAIGQLIPASSATLLTFSATWNSDNDNPADIVWPDRGDARGVKWIIDDSCVKLGKPKDASRIPASVKQVVEVLPGAGKGAHRLHRMATLLADVLAQGGNALVFVMYKQEAVQVARDLSRLLGKEDDGLCASLHGDMSSHARSQVLNRFRRGECKILVATDVAARGLDVEFGVSFVLNASLGMTIENYVHRCGRTGRPPLNRGTAHTLIVKGDEHLTPDLVHILQASGAVVPEELRELALRWKQKAAKKEQHQQQAASGGGGIEDEDEQQQILEQRILNREKQKAIQEKKMSNERKQSKGQGKGGRKKKGH